MAKKRKISNNDEIIKFVQGKMSDAKTHTQTWRANQVKWHKLRMRIKKAKTSPFVGCSNIRMPTAETKIRKLKASLINVIFGMRPIAQVIPTPSGSLRVAQKIEKFLDHLLMDVIKLKQIATIAIDRVLEKGFFLLKPYWKLEITKRKEEFSLDELSEQEKIAFNEIKKSPMVSEIILREVIKRLNVDLSPEVYKENMEICKNAVKQILAKKNKISVEVQDVISNNPDIALCDSEYVYVPSDSGYNPQDCNFIVHEFYLPLRQLKTNTRLKGWDKTAIDDIELNKNIDLKSRKIDITKDTREGIERLQNPSELVKIQEIYCWYDLNGDGEQEKCIFTISADFNKVLRKITLPLY